jgi:hypothetical protein
MDARGDDRAVSTVIGAVLLFAIIVVLLATYQATVVPNQNRATEFDHSNAVQNDMLELRNALLTAKTAGRITFAEVTLGTTYPNRVLAVNPPPAAGTLRTGDARPITVTADGGVSNLCPSTGTIQSRTLRYSPGYNAYQNAPDVVYENTVLYLDFGDRKITLTDEELVRDDGDIVDIVPLNTSFDAEGVNTESIEPLPGNVNERELTDATVTLPTNLSESTWEELLAEDLPPSNVTVSNDNLTIQTGGEISVSCSPLGLNEAPAGGRRADESLEINPAGPNDVTLESVSRSGGTVIAEFNNTGNRDTNFTAARMPFVRIDKQNVEGSEVDPYAIINQETATTVVSGLEIGDPLTSFNQGLRLPGNDTQTSVGFDFDGSSSSFTQGGFFVVTLQFSNGATGTYFVEIPK